MEDDKFKVALLGPSGVGKTTLLASMFDDTQDRLRGTSLNVVLDTHTRARINEHRKELNEAVGTQVFESGSLGGTQSADWLDFSLRSINNRELEIPFEILDYPGGWLDPAARESGAVSEEGWEQVETHIEHSILALLPIDAALLMEARNPAERAASLHLLGIVDVHDMVRLWARSRNTTEHRDEPAVLMLVPVKCEKYLDPSRPAGSDADALRARIQALYDEITETVRKEARDRTIRILYKPVETYGCIQLVDSFWKLPTTRGSRHPVFEGIYRFTSNSPQRRITGAGAVMRQLCLTVLEGREKVRELEEHGSREQQQEFLSRMAQRRGFWKAFGYRMRGEARRDKGGVIGTQRDAERVARSRRELESDMRGLAEATDPQSQAEDWTSL
ncbi:MAG TPA: hypothetical protein VGS97_21430 [Actinocrinis sp.]|uniref:hypothetical protein n=1 Tax=Actinocrinis sp. TaxID=1920516 RepID=UPI002DDDBCEC|nr:hypothetical protein [Actinocrinis sp.]HEV2346677.1 hypothetical protein [Actinocrinis sp.]